MAKFTPKRHEQILAQMIAQLVSRTDLSDVADSSIVKHVLAAAARQDDEQYYQMSLLLQLFSLDSATGEDLDERAKDVQPNVITRNDPVSATGLVVFSRAGTTGTVNIPIGTKVKNSDGDQFTTTQLATITAASVEQISGHGVGRDSNPVGAVADVPGTAGNVVGGTIIKFVTKPAGVDEVTNPSSFQFGLDRETDDSLRNRIKNFISSLAKCTVSAIEFGVIGQQDPAINSTILFAKAIEDIVNRGEVILYIDDGTGQIESTVAVVGENVTEGLAGPPADSAVGGEVRLALDFGAIKGSLAITLSSSSRGALTRDTEYTLDESTGNLVFTPALVAAEVITAGYTRYTGLIAWAQIVVNGDVNDRENFPGLRAAGCRVTVLPPQALIQPVTAVVVIQSGFAQAEVLLNVAQAIKDYVNGLSISGDVIRSKLIAAIMSVDGVADTQMSAPANNVIVLDDQLVRVTDAVITVT